MKVDHVVPSIQAEASGPSYVVPSLCKVLADNGVNIGLHVLSPVPDFDNFFAVHAYKPTPIFPSRLGVSTGLKKGLVHAAREVDILHNHSLWMMPNIYPGKAVNNTKCCLVISPHGTLSGYALSRSKWLKKAVWALGQGDVLKKTSCFHATSEAECRDIRRMGFNAPVAIVPNGVDIPANKEGESRYDGLRRLLYFGRIHPIKGINNLIRAWAIIQGKFPDWELCIAGADRDGYKVQLEALVQSKKAKRVSFAGPFYGSEKSKIYNSGEIYVLPTHTENFGMTVAEALAHEVPVITTKGAPWAGLEKEKCGWWIDIGVEPLVECLKEAMSLSFEELVIRGQRGRAWMKQDFSWDHIGKMMYKTYEWVLGGGTPPDWVITD